MQQLPPLTDIGLDFSNNLFSLRLGGALLPNFISEADVFIYFDPAFLSHIFVKVRDMVPQDAHNKGDPAYPGSFTGAYLISTVQAQIRERLDSHMIRADVLERLDSGFVDRRLCLEIVRSLQSQILFSKVQGGGNTIQDDAEGLFMFADDPRYSSNGDGESPGIPTAIITPLTRCYAPSCNDMTWCYSCTCPRRQSLPLHASPVQQDKTLMSLPRTDICNEVSNGTVVNGKNHTMTPSVRADNHALRSAATTSQYGTH
ncbi:hypothetical protein OBBRIDRAFT_228749 [Obba rivulosa]|uniref:Uncharacterized protein n=1 Tax=Obba rivulosa TaxID=1052685 RepID=A0A8E2DUJ9_9APHY|nr:hypothetical protein OBBRIDRAFT_228749 [Obba rivulosa]